jgi:dipeptidyl-peptidase-3
MRNRHGLVLGHLKKGKKDKVIKKITRNGKTYFNITNYVG